MNTFDVHTEGTGTSTLGDFTFDNNEEIIFDSGIPGIDGRGRVVNGRAIFTFADGSTLTRIHTGTFEAVPFSTVATFETTGPIIEGTGRFSGATGSADFRGATNVALFFIPGVGTVEGTFTGSVTLP